jgi:hypothetical protein
MSLIMVVMNRACFAPLSSPGILVVKNISNNKEL